jgi:hypothetical protein
MRLNRAGSGSADSLAGHGTAINHVDGSDLTLGLQHNHTCSFPRHFFLEFLKHLTLRSDRVSEISVGAVADHRHGEGFVTLHQCYFIVHIVRQ